MLISLWDAAPAADYREFARRRREAADETVRRSRYALFAVVAVEVWLPFVGLDLAKAMGWSNTFVGTLFVARVTSVPEIVGRVSRRRLTQVKHYACTRGMFCHSLHPDDRTACVGDRL